MTVGHWADGWAESKVGHWAVSWAAPKAVLMAVLMVVARAALKVAGSGLRWAVPRVVCWDWTRAAMTVAQLAQN